MRFRVVLIERLRWPDTGTHSWRWRLMSAGNNLTLAHSEIYSNRRNAEKTASALAAALGVELEVELADRYYD